MLGAYAARGIASELDSRFRIVCETDPASIGLLDFMRIETRAQDAVNDDVRLSKNACESFFIGVDECGRSRQLQCFKCANCSVMGGLRANLVGCAIGDHVDFNVMRHEVLSRHPSIATVVSAAAEKRYGCFLAFVTKTWVCD